MAVAKDYRSWSFTDRSFLFALTVSALWHLFWFFSVTIVVTPTKIKRPIQTKTVSLGPVLNDAIFKTLVESRPEYSKAFYRELSDFQAATEIPAETVERHESGDVTSLPVGENFIRSLKALIGGDKASPEDAARHLVFSADDSFFELSGDLEKSRILSRPERPAGILPTPVEIDFEVDGAGKVTGVELVRSSQDTQLDLEWEDYLRQWLFTPAPILGSEGRAKGKVVFRTPAPGE